MDFESKNGSDEVENDDKDVCIICQEKLSTHIELAKMTPCKYGGCKCNVKR